MAYPKLLENLIKEFEKFPGIGRRTAERLALHLMRLPAAEAMGFAELVRGARKHTSQCSQCGHLGENDPCTICEDAGRDRSLLCVVEEPKDVESMERSGIYKGLYHVLQGALNPAHGSGPKQLNLQPLVKRVRQGKFREVILATDPDFEGDATALYVAKALKPVGIPLTKLARGVPPGTSIEFLNRAILTEALEGRKPVV